MPGCQVSGMNSFVITGQVNPRQGLGKDLARSWQTLRSLNQAVWACQSLANSMGRTFQGRRKVDGLSKEDAMRGFCLLQEKKSPSRWLFLSKDSVTEKISATASDGKNYMMQFYNLDAIISVGYRVNSVRATQFRQWATSVLFEKYRIVQDRLFQSDFDRYLGALPFEEEGKM